MACIISVDPSGSVATVEIGMDESKAGEWNEIHAVAETEMVLGYSGCRDLCQVPDRGKQDQATERKIRVHVIVEVQTHATPSQT